MVYVQAASQGRFAEMLAQQAELTAAMTPPPARRPGDHHSALKSVQMPSFYTVNRFPLQFMTCTCPCAALSDIPIRSLGVCDHSQRSQQPCTLLPSEAGSCKTALERWDSGSVGNVWHTWSWLMTGLLWAYAGQSGWL